MNTKLKNTEDADTFFSNLAGTSMQIIDLPRVCCEDCLFENSECAVLEQLNKIDRSWEQLDLTFEEKEKQTALAKKIATQSCLKGLFDEALINIDELKDFIDEISLSNRNEDNRLGQTNLEQTTELVNIECVTDNSIRNLLIKISRLLSNLEAKEVPDTKCLGKFEVGLNLKEGWRKVAILTIRGLKNDPNRVVIGPNTWIKHTGQKITTLYKIKGPITVPKTIGDTEVSLIKTVGGHQFFVAKIELVSPNVGLHRYGLLFELHMMKLFTFYNKHTNWFRAWAKPSFQNRYGEGSPEGWIIPHK